MMLCYPRKFFIFLNFTKGFFCTSLFFLRNFL
nr:MAG TPA: hypothetical protein [Caudoviricetes sp.]